MIDKIDMVLLMSVNPGFGGQKFIPQALGKLAEARARIEAADATCDWKSTEESRWKMPREIAAAGADTFVAGSAIFGSFRLCGHDQGHARPDRNGAATSG